MGAVTAYSPLGGKGNPGAITDLLLNDAVLKEIGDAHGKTPAQVILRWNLQRGIVPIPKSSTQSRIEQNFDVFDFELSTEEMDTIAKQDVGLFVILDADKSIA